MAKRKMPEPGFYVYPAVIDTNVWGKSYHVGGEIIYTNGVSAGIKKGGVHRYIRFDDLEENDRLVDANHENWVILQWNCVPGKRSIKDYLYAETIKKAIDLYNTFINNSCGITKIENHPYPLKVRK